MKSHFRYLFKLSQKNLGATIDSPKNYRFGRRFDFSRFGRKKIIYLLLTQSFCASKCRRTWPTVYVIWSFKTWSSTTGMVFDHRYFPVQYWRTYSAIVHYKPVDGLQMQRSQFYVEMNTERLHTALYGRDTRQIQFTATSCCLFQDQTVPYQHNG